MLLAGGAFAAYSYDANRDDLIAKGVTVAGIDVGGMRRAAATALVQKRLADPLGRPIAVKARGHRFHLSAERSGLTADVGGMIAEAVTASREGNVIQRSWRDLTGGKVHKAVALRLSYNDRAVRSFVRHIARRIGQAPTDASVTPSAGGLSTTHAREGIALQGPTCATASRRRWSRPKRRGGSSPTRGSCSRR
jgi:hypothetical protein